MHSNPAPMPNIGQEEKKLRAKKVIKIERYSKITLTNVIKSSFYGSSNISYRLQARGALPVDCSDGHSFWKTDKSFTKEKDKFKKKYDALFEEKHSKVACNPKNFVYAFKLYMQHMYPYSTTMNTEYRVQLQIKKGSLRRVHKGHTRKTSIESCHPALSCPLWTRRKNCTNNYVPYLTWIHICFLYQCLQFKFYNLLR